MNDLYGNKYTPTPIHVNIYADEIQGKPCSITKNLWDYIGIIVEKTDDPILSDIINQRFKNNLDKKSPYYEKNNKLVHWSDMRTGDTKNICKRWFEYIIDPIQSSNKFYSYILGINTSFINKSEFNTDDEFNSIYNRFFRSAILYGLKTFFKGQDVLIENIYHEEGQQQHNEYFPWHSIYKINKEDNINCLCDRITFLPKDHRLNELSNVIQVCDCILGVSSSLIHGIESSNASKYREELADIYSPILTKMMCEPNNPNCRYAHKNRILIRFFPKQKTTSGNIERLINQFYYKRPMCYIEQKSGQQKFSFN